MKLKGKRIETKEQQRDRIANLLAAEVAGMQTAGIPNEVLGLKVYDALIDARMSIEDLNVMIKHLHSQLRISGKIIAKDAKTSKPC